MSQISNQFIDINITPIDDLKTFIVNHSKNCFYTNCNKSKTTELYCDEHPSNHQIDYADIISKIKFIGDTMNYKFSAIPKDENKNNAICNVIFDILTIVKNNRWILFMENYTFYKAKALQSVGYICSRHMADKISVHTKLKEFDHMYDVNDE